MRVVNAILLVGVLGGCTSVRVVQRDGCWVRRTEKWGQVREEVGPCAHPTPAWSQDRLTRLVQECVARVDYRWQARAVAAWSRGERLPEQASEATTLQECMDESARAVLSDPEELKARMAEVTADRDALRAREEDDRTHLLETHDKLAEYLGKAAEKAAPPAVATATASSEGRARTDTGTRVAAPATAASPGAPERVLEARTPPLLRRARMDNQKPATPPLPACEPAAPAPDAHDTAPAHEPSERGTPP